MINEKEFKEFLEEYDRIYQAADKRGSGWHKEQILRAYYLTKIVKKLDELIALQTPKPPGKRGRPKGAKNKPKEEYD